MKRALVITLAVIAALAYFIDIGDRLKWFDAPPRLTDVYDKTFSNDTVIIDNKAFHNCVFENVTFQYGEGNFIMENATISGPLRFQTPSSSVNNAIRFLKGIGALQPDFAAAWRSIPTSMIKRDDRWR